MTAPPRTASLFDLRGARDCSNVKGMTLEAVKEAIAELPNPGKTSLVTWLDAQDVEAWDRQLEADFSEGGAVMALLEPWDLKLQKVNRFLWMNSSGSARRQLIPNS